MTCSGYSLTKGMNGHPKAQEKPDVATLISLKKNVNNPERYFKI